MNRPLKRADVTYGQLDKVLRALGFTCHAAKHPPPGRIYRHEASGATIMFPEVSDSERVYEYHLLTARVELDNFGIADPTTFAAKLQKAG